MRGVIFDCFGVLCGSSFEVLAAKCQPERVKELRDLNTQADYGYISSAEYVRGVAAVLGWTIDEVRATLKQARVRNEPLITYVKQLHADGIPLALLSNVSSGTLDGLFAPGELDDMFDVKILSFAEGLAKPNPAVFTLAVERLSMPAGDCVMVDDKPENCDGAEVAGLSSILHTSNAQTMAAIQAWLEAAHA